jgi:Fe-S-cluster-containing dehydrogenase component
MARYGMVLDLDRCIGCYNCQIACKDEHVGNEFHPVAKPQPTFGHFWIGIREVERQLSPSRIRVHYLPVPCQQCGDAPCMKAAKDDAVYRRADGIVIIDPKKALGQRQLVESCPYGAIFWNEEQNLAQKCTFCAHLLDDGWSQPRCVQTCPAGCMNFGDLEDPQSKPSRLLADGKGEALHPQWKAKPNVFYSGLPKPHVSGRVLYGDKDEWAADVVVTLLGTNGTNRQTRTDAYGEFAFDAPQEKTCTIRFDAPGYASQSREVALEQDVSHLGDVVLKTWKENDA